LDLFYTNSIINIGKQFKQSQNLPRIQIIFLGVFVGGTAKQSQKTQKKYLLWIASYSPLD
jgi:hypothetical protein